MRRCWLLATVAALIGSALVAQKGITQRGPEPGVVQLGGSSRVELRVETKTPPRPAALPEVAGLKLQLAGPSYTEQSSWVNGRMTTARYYTYRLLIKPQREGKFEIPAFTFQVDGVDKKVGPFKIDVVTDISGRDYAFLRITPSRERVYYNEPLRFRIRYGVDTRLPLGRHRVGGGFVPAIVLEAPWLDQIKGLEPMEPIAPSGKTLQLLVNSGVVEVSYTPGVKDQDKSYHYFEFERAFLPTKSGKITLPKPILTFTQRLTKDRMGIFGEFTPGETKERYVYGEPITVEVVPLPEEGRPKGYTGAVGRFKVQSIVDKPAVKVGGSIKLTLEVAGDGNTEFFELPERLEFDGFHCLGRLEKRSRGKAQSIYDLTPTKASVEEIPAIPFSYFDTTPGVERYVTTKTKPIKLTVIALVGKKALKALAADAPEAITPGIDDIFDMKPDHGEPVLVPSPPARSTALLVSLAPWLVAFLSAFFLRHRRLRRADVLGERSRRAARVFEEAIQSDGGSAYEVFVQYLADRLGCEPAAIIEPDLADRLRGAGMEESLATIVQSSVESGIAARYGGDAVAADSSRLRELVQKIEGATLGRFNGAFAILVIALMAAGLQAQTGSSAEQSYRSGDYAAAAAAFEKAAATGDRRAAYNLGNSLFRQKKYALALAAYERARLGMPRDEQLLANVRLTRERLDLQATEADSFLATLVALREAFTSQERLWLCILANALAAGILLFGGRRLRIAGVIFLIPAVVFLADLWLSPNLPPKGIVTAARTKVRAEPNDKLDALMTLRPGVQVRVVGEGDAWIRVEVGNRTGYVQADRVATIR